MEKEKIWNRGYTTIISAHSLIAVALYMLIPTFPLFLVSLGAQESQAGMVVTAYYISTILTRFFLNVVLSRVGKKRVLICGVVVCIVVMASYSLVDSVIAAAALRVVQGVGLGTVSSIASTMAVDFLPDSRRGEGVGYFTMGTILSTVIAPAIALYVREHFGFNAMFLVASFISLLSLFIVLTLREPKLVKTETAEKKPAIEWRNLFDKRLIMTSAFVLLFGICRAVDMNYIALFAEARGIDHLSWFFVIQTVTMFCIRFFVGRFSDRKGRNWVIIPGGIAVLAMMIVLSLANSSAMLLLGAFISGLGVGVLAPTLLLWMLSVVDAEKRIVANSAYLNFMDIGSAISAPLMGLVAEKLGYTSMFRAGGCAAALFLVLYLLIGRQKKSDRLAAAVAEPSGPELKR